MQEADNQIPVQTPATVFLEKILSRKCKIHPQFSCQYIHLKPSEFSPRLCFQCMEDRNISLNEAISIQLLLQGTNNTTFNTYPKFEDNSITQKIKDLKNSDDRISTDLSTFFNNLHAAVSQAIENAESAAQQNLSSLSNSYQGVFNSLDQISKIEHFQELVKDSNENEEKLSGFIQDQYSSMNKYTEEINNKLLQYQKINQSFSLTDANNKLSQIIQLIQEITLFPTIANKQQQQQQPCQQQQQQQILMKHFAQKPLTYQQQQHPKQLQKSQQQPSSSQSVYDYQQSLIKRCKEKYNQEYEQYFLRAFLEGYFKADEQQKVETKAQKDAKAQQDAKSSALDLQQRALKAEALKALQKYEYTYEQWQALSEEHRQGNLSYLENELGILD